VDQLPERDFSHLTLNTEAEWRRAFVLLTFIGQSYIWGEGQSRLVDRVPSKIAKPWCAVSDHLKLKPMVCYASTVLYNFTLKDPRGPLDAENVSIINTFTGTVDESWFYIVPVLIERAAVPALGAIKEVFVDMHYSRDDRVNTCLQVVRESLKDMRFQLSRMFEKCSPVKFYTEIRPFQAGSKGLDVFPDGIIFEGVDPLPRQYNGASAAQSSIIHVFDVFLGTTFSGSELDFLQTMRSHMPLKHAQFLKKLGEMPSVRDYCVASRNRDLITSYNGAVEELGEFRCDHIVMVTRYIVNQLQHSVNSSLNTKGSGGTDFMKFLKKVRDETNALIIT
jgi:indoleamine 2,3-dioxygenase